MKRLKGYYWVQMHPLYTGVMEAIWVVCLYNEINGIGLWLAPGLAEPLTDAHFKTISEQPLQLPVPQPESSILWTPGQK